MIYGTHYNADATVYAYLMIAPDGSRTELRQITGNVYESFDSAHIQLIDNGSGSLTVRTMDGQSFVFQHGKRLSVHSDKRHQRQLPNHHQR